MYSGRFVSGSRLLFWLHAATSALSVSGYASGTDSSFSINDPTMRRSVGSRSRAMTASVPVRAPSGEPSTSEVDGSAAGRQPQPRPVGATGRLRLGEERV